MAEAVLNITDFIGTGNRCPSCLGKVEIIGIRDTVVHISCPRCSWSELFLAVYGVNPSEVPWAYEEIPPVHPL